jgi:glycosyltransferase involved in cell wall biosynthesis
LNRLPHEKYLKLHENAWGLLFPSICEEPLPYAIVESSLLSTIPIASKVGGIPEIVEGTVAERFLFEPGNVKNLLIE